MESVPDLVAQIIAILASGMILMIGICKAVERGKVRVEDNHLKIFTAALAALLMYESVEFSNPGH